MQYVYGVIPEGTPTCAEQAAIEGEAYTVGYTFDVMYKHIDRPPTGSQIYFVCAQAREMRGGRGAH
jgi:hypothetical protein